MKIHIFLLISLLLSCQKEEVIPTDIPTDIPTGGDFSIPTTTGVFNSQDHKGKTIFLFFGFTQCPHVCPLTLLNLRNFNKMLPEAEQKKVEFIFISVDTERDNMETLKKRLEGYPANFHGGIDTKENLQKVLTKFGATYNVIKGKDPTDIIIDHTALIFVINKKGQWVESLKYDSKPEELFKTYAAVDKMSPIYAEHRRKKAVEVMAENKECDLSQTPCELNGYEVSIGPFPITSEKDFKVQVKNKNSSSPPVEIDFEGVENNMGYIRPSFRTAGDDNYTADFRIPVCELPEMKWRASLYLDTPQGRKSLLFYFKTVHP